MNVVKVVRKLAANHAVGFMFIIPNITISLGAQAYFVGYLHWTGWYAILSWLIGAGGGFEAGQLIAVYTKSNFKIGKWAYNYGLKKDEAKT